jgi:acyl carrier protein
VGRGYLNRAAQTAEKFVDDPFRAGERMYRTGDLGRWLPEGNIEFIGRRDGQVKIRGFRVEVGEIESVLERQGSIRSAVVTARANGDGEKELIAYIVGSEELNLTEVQWYLRRELPSYMIPGHYLRLETLPLTANGKIDRKRLPEPEGLRMGSGVTYTEARNETEQKLVEIWQEVLGRKRIGVKDDFFDLGGNSLRATRLASQIHKRFEVKLNVDDLFSRTMLEDQAVLIGELQRTLFAPIPTVEDRESYPMSSVQRRLWVLSHSEAGNTAYNVGETYVFEGKMDWELLERCFQELIGRHEILRTVFREDNLGEVRQFVLDGKEISFRVEYRDMRGGREEQVRARVQEELARPFDLSSGPLLRAVLLEVGEEKYVFTYVMHHIISDAWSTGILIRELLSLYNGGVRGEAVLLAPLRVQYRDYASWQQEQLGGTGFQAAREYWLEQFSGEVPVLELLGDRVRPAVKTYRGGMIERRLRPGTCRQLRALLHDQATTLFMGLLAAVNVLLYRYTGQKTLW